MYFKFKLEIMSIYDGQFRGNVLVVGRTAYGKSYFFKNLFLTFFLAVFPTTHCLKYFKVIVCQQLLSMSLYVLCG